MGLQVAQPLFLSNTNSFTPNTNPRSSPMADLHHHNKTNGGRDWSSLPSDVLSTIADNFLPLPDHLRFRSVCKSWSNSIPPLSMPSPLLILPTNAVDSLTFCSLASLETTFDSPVPSGIAGTHIVGSLDGWLALSDLALNVFLFNPFTADRVDLPAFTTLPYLKLLFTMADDCSTTTVDVSHLYRQPVSTIKRRGCYIRKIVFSSSPTAENFMAVAIDMTGGLVYARAGEDTWNSFGGRMNYLTYNCVHDVLFHDGRFWAVNENGKLLALDLRGEGLPEVSLVFDKFDIRLKYVELSEYDGVLCGNMYLAVGNTGNIVVVFRYRGEDEDEDEDEGEGEDGDEDGEGKGFHGRSLVVIEFVGPKFDRVRRVRSLKGQSLLVGYNNGFSLHVEEGHRLRGDCVFVTDIIYGRRHKEYDMGFFGMGNESFELMFPRCMEFKWCQPPPVIVIPNLKWNNLEDT